MVKLTSEALNEKAYDALKDSILSKEFPEGMRLVDTKLGEQYGVSRTPIRDALMKLSEEGLVSKEGKGYSVCKPTKKDICDIFELRLMIDIYAARKVITEILPNDPQAEQRLNAAYLSGVEGNKDEHFVQNDEEFHGCIVALTGNSRLIDFYAILRNQMRAFRGVTSLQPNRITKACNYHERIYKAIVARDADKAADAITLHTTLSMQDALADFAE